MKLALLFKVNVSTKTLFLKIVINALERGLFVSLSKISPLTNLLHSNVVNNSVLFVSKALLLFVLITISAVV